MKTGTSHGPYALALTIGIAIAITAFAGTTLAASKDVIVVNDESAAVPVQDVSDLLREPVQYVVNIQNTGAAGTGILTTVPADRRLVIEFLSAGCSSPVGERPQVILISTGADFRFTVVNYDNPPTSSAYATHVTKLYAPPSWPVQAQVYPSSTAGSVSCDVSISGYLTDP